MQRHIVHVLVQPCFHGPHAHLVPLSVTKHRPVHFTLNPGHVEYMRVCARRTYGLKIRTYDIPLECRVR